MDQFAGKVAVVTGASRGIGFAIAEAFGTRNCRVVLADIDDQRMTTAASQLQARDCEVRAVAVDVTSEESVRALISNVEQHERHVDFLINSAGVAPHIHPAIGLSVGEWRRVIDVNLFGVFLCCKEIGAHMARHQRGNIINIASLNAVSPAALCVAYNVAKAGVISLTQTMAIELAPVGVRVNAISPGPVETEFHDVVMPERASTLGITREQMIEKVRQGIPLGRWGNAADIAQAAVFLASEQSSWITGQNLVVSGGASGVGIPPPKDIIIASSGA